MKRLLLASLLSLSVLTANADMVLREDTASQTRQIGPFVDTTGAAVTSLTIANTDVKISKNGAAAVNKNSGGCTHDVNGMYLCTFDATDSSTAGSMQISVVKTGALPVYHEFQVGTQAAYDACCASTAAPLTASAVWANSTRTLSSAANITSTGSTITLTGGNVTVGTNNDKTGYSLTQTFPTNFSSLAITVGGAVTAGTVSDKTGYSLSQAFPTNFSSLAITGGGAVTAGTVSDKTGYALSSTQTFNNTGTWTGNISGSVGTATALGTDAVNSTSLAASAVTEIWSATCSEPAAKPSWGSSTAKDWICWIGAFSRNKVTQTSTTKTLRNDADNANIVQCTVSDDGTTFTLNECTP